MSFLRCLGLIVLVAGCGGGTPEPVSPAEKEPGDQSVESTKTRRASRQARVTCDDGSCFSCGEAVCLAGFYCTATRRGHGCAWAPGCATKATCACLASSLRDTPSCVCEEKDGGVYVICDGAKL